MWNITCSGKDIRDIGQGKKYIFGPFSPFSIFSPHLVPAYYKCSHESLQW